MTFEEYQTFINETAIYPNKGKNILYPVLGLTGEGGEVAEKIKKLYRDHDGVLTEDIRKELVKELGDVLWYVAAMAVELGVSLGDVAENNIKKLKDRKSRGVIHGDGDNR